MKIKIDIEQLIRNFSEVSDLFYKQMNAEAYSKLTIVLNEIEQVMNELKILYSDNNYIGFNEKEINNSLRDAMTAMEKNDNILLADIMKYVLTEQFENIMNNLK